MMEENCHCQEKRKYFSNKLFSGTFYEEAAFQELMEASFSALQLRSYFKLALREMIQSLTHEKNITSYQNQNLFWIQNNFSEKLEHQGLGVSLKSKKAKHNRKTKLYVKLGTEHYSLLHWDLNGTIQMLQFLFFFIQLKFIWKTYEVFGGLFCFLLNNGNLPLYMLSEMYFQHQAPLKYVTWYQYLNICLSLHPLTLWIKYLRIIIKIFIHPTIFANFIYIKKKNSPHQKSK